MLLICKICFEEFEKTAFPNHIKKIHKLDFSEYVREYYPEKGGYCEVCGEKTSLKNFADGFRKYCSKQCANNCTEKKEKSKNTCIKKYGVSSPGKCESVKAKIRETCLEKYGVENPSQSEEIKEKIHNTFIETYGTHPSKVAEFKEKTKQTNLERYGVESHNSADSIKKKKKQVCLEKYGVENPFQLEETKEKSKQTCLEKYGVEYSMQSEEVKHKAVFTKKYNNYDLIKLLLQKHKGITLLDTKEEWTNSNIDTEHKFCCSKHGEFKQTFVQINTLSCRKCIEESNKSISAGEKELLDFIQSIYSGTIIENDRSILNGKELDIYLPEKNLAIEFDGIHWHSNLFKDKKYHLEKTLECTKKNIQLIHIFDIEWASKRNIVQNIISSKLGIYKERYYARKLQVKEVSNTDYKLFSELYHLQGYTIANTVLGLYGSDRLLAIASFGKSRYKQNETELLRFCCIENIQIIGGLSKLISHYLQNKNCTLVSYCDRRYSNGNGYLNSGFELESTTDPNYYYFNGKQLESRMKYQKHKLSNILENFDPNLTEQENMLNNGYQWIYDCGNYKFRWK